MPADLSGKVQPWFTINESLSTVVTASTNENVEKITAVAFDKDVDIIIGGLTTAFTLAKGVPMGIDSSTSTIQIDVDAFMFAMGGK